MLKYAWSILIFGLVANADPNNSENLNGYLLKIQFSYKHAGREVATSHEVIVNEQNQEWIPLSSGNKGVALLGKIHKGDKDLFTAEYMIVDTATSPVFLQRMGMVGQFGRKSEIQTDTPPQKVAVSLLATPTKYKEQR